jgi:hypothetical protein
VTDYPRFILDQVDHDERLLHYDCQYSPKKGMMVVVGYDWANGWCCDIEEVQDEDGENILDRIPCDLGQKIISAVIANFDVLRAARNYLHDRPELIPSDSPDPSSAYKEWRERQDGDA